MSVQHSTQYKDVPSWGLSDSFWERIKPLIPKPKSRLRGRGKRCKHLGGRPGAKPRRVMAGILCVLRTGCQWNATLSEYGSGKTLHRYFQRWARARVFKKLWKNGLEEYDELKGIAWKWQAAAGEPTEQLAEERGYEVHVPDKANAKKKQKRKGGRRR
jgi:transposase